MKKHFTATAFIVDSQNRTLLLHHKRLDRWMPPGGHIDEDETPAEAAKRECKEETGLDVEIIGSRQDDLFEGNPQEGAMLIMPMALLLENIPACEKRREEEHQHMDFVFHARPIDESQDISLAEEEGHELRWFTRAEIEQLDPSSEIYSNVRAYCLREMN